MFRRVLVANRGEIAIRILRSLRELEIESVAVFSDGDKSAAHLRYADFAFPIGPPEAHKSYLNIDRIIATARQAGVDAIIPGYGFLSENAAFCQACGDAGFTFIGPSASVIEQMGSKTRAREIMGRAGVPLIPGAHVDTLAEAKTHAARLGYPILIKAALGGGGKGMRLAHSEHELSSTLAQSKSEALRAFGSDQVYLEKALVGARHIEVQVLGDQHGQVRHLFERDCSIQRRHQKILEEAPAPRLTLKTRERLREIAITAARAVNYTSAGTLEFLVDADENIYFLEMNTRLQVEHTVTELVTGLDLVAEMVRIAAGGHLFRDSEPEALRATPSITADPRDVANGSAIQCRIYAEDPANSFFPSTGVIEHLVEPSGPFVRVDSGIRVGQTITSDYDPMLAKLCVWGQTREQAIARMRRALDEYCIIGVTTNLNYQRRILRQADFIKGNYDIGFVSSNEELTVDPPPSSSTQAALVAATHVSRAARPLRALEPSPAPWVLAHRARLHGN